MIKEVIINNKDIKKKNFKNTFKTILLFIIFSVSAKAQCPYPANLMVSDTIGQGEYVAYKATNTVDIKRLKVEAGGNVIVHAPKIIVYDTSLLQPNVKLKAENPCTATQSYPDSLIASNRAVCAGCYEDNATTLTVYGRGTPLWKWYKNEDGDDSPPNLASVIGVGTSITVAPLHKTDYFVRDESTIPYGNFAGIKITVPIITFFYDTAKSVLNNISRKIDTLKIESISKGVLKFTCNKNYKINCPCHCKPYILVNQNPLYTLDTTMASYQASGFIRKIDNLVQSIGDTTFTANTIDSVTLEEVMQAMYLDNSPLELEDTIDLSVFKNSPYVNFKASSGNKLEFKIYDKDHNKMEAWAATVQIEWEIKSSTENEDRMKLKRVMLGQHPTNIIYGLELNMKEFEASFQITIKGGANLINVDIAKFDVLQKVLEHFEEQDPTLKARYEQEKRTKIIDQNIPSVYRAIRKFETVKTFTIPVPTRGGRIPPRIPDPDNPGETIKTGIEIPFQIKPELSLKINGKIPINTEISLYTGFNKTTKKDLKVEWSIGSPTELTYIPPAFDSVRIDVKNPTASGSLNFDASFEIRAGPLKTDQSLSVLGRDMEYEGYIYAAVKLSDQIVLNASLIPNTTASYYWDAANSIKADFEAGVKGQLFTKKISANKVFVTVPLLPWGKYWWAPATLSTVMVPNTSGCVGQELSNPFRVEVRDQNTFPFTKTKSFKLPFVAVDFIADKDGKANPRTPVTGADGQAETKWTLPSTITDPDINGNGLSSITAKIYKADFSLIASQTASAMVKGVPEQPNMHSALQFVVNCMEATPSWDASLGATGYKLNLSLSPDFRGVTQVYVAGENLYYHVNNLDPATTYYFSVQAYNSCGESPLHDSAPYLKTDPIDVPSSIATAISGCNSIIVSWASTQCGDGYSVDIAENASFTVGVVNKTLNGLTNTFTTFTGLKYNQTYHIRVKAIHSSTGKSGAYLTTLKVISSPLTVDLGPHTVCFSNSYSLSAIVTGGERFPTTNDYLYSWSSNPPGFTSSLANPPPVSPSVATTYTCIVVDKNECSVIDAITLNPNPSLVTVTGDGTFCGGSFLMASGGEGGTIYYQGTTINGENDAIGNAINSTVVTTPGTNTYYFRSKSVEGCWGVQGYAKVNINPMPSTSEITGNTSVCANKANVSYSVVNSLNSNYSWTVPTGSIITSGSIGPNNNLITVTFGTNTGSIGSIIVTETNSYGCEGSSVILPVVVNPNPTISGTLSTCVNSSTQLTGSPIQHATTPWVSSLTGIATVSNTGLVTGVSAGVSPAHSDITYMNTNGCTKTETVTIFPLPTISGTLTVCKGLTTQLTGSGTPHPTIIPWASSNTGIATVSNTGVVKGIAEGQSTITYIDINGCAKKATVTVNPNPTANAGSDRTICYGFNTTLGAFDGPNSITGSGGTPPYEYIWTPATGLISNIIANPNATLTANISYTVLVTDARNCKAQDVVDLFIYALPLITKHPINKSICVGASWAYFLIEANGIGLTYRWQANDGSGFKDITSTDPFYSYYSGITSTKLEIISAQAGMNGYKYRCIITDFPCGLSAESFGATLSVYSEPTLTIANETLPSCGFCNGSATAFGSGGSGNFSYEWWTSDLTYKVCETSICGGLCEGTSYRVYISDNITSCFASIQYKPVCPAPAGVEDFFVTAPYKSPTRSTCGAVNNCSTHSSEEHIYKVTIPSTGNWSFSLCGSLYDTYLKIGTTVCESNIGYNDDNYCNSKWVYQSTWTGNLSSGTYYVAVEGYAGACGSYVMDISSVVSKSSTISTIIKEEKTAEKTVLDNFIKIYPNPTTDKFVVDMLFDKEQAAVMVSVTNILGEVILKHKLNDIKKELYQIDLSKYGAGIYFIQVEADIVSEKRKVVVIR